MATKYCRADGVATWADATSAAAAATSCTLATAVDNVAAGDTVYISGLGGVYRTTLRPTTSGTDGSVISYIGSDTPVLSGANLVTGWEVYSGSVYRASFVYEQWVTEEPTQVFIDGTFGDPQTSTGACVNEYDWFWDADYLYLYAPGDPDTEYTSPGVEACTRFQACTFDNYDYLLFDGLTFKYTIQNGFEAWHSSNITVQNCIAEWNYHDGIAFYADSSSYSDFLVDSNTVRYNGIQGIVILGEATSGLIKRNDVYGNIVYQRGGTPFQWGGGIKCFGHDTLSWIDGVVIEQNKVHDNGYDYGPDNRGDGIWLDATGTTTPNVIRHNLVYDNVASGLHIERAMDSAVYGNVIYGNGGDGGTSWPTAGIRIVGTDTFAKDVDGTLVYNNTITGNSIGIYSGGDSTSQVVNTVIKNNIISGNTAQELYCAAGADNDTTNGSGNVYEQNCLGAEGSNFIYWNGNISTYDAFISASSQTDNNIESDPTFTDSDNDDYTHAAGSTAIGAGVNLGASYDDGLLPTSTWPDGVLTADRDDY